jgi:hypothetical protein
VVALGAAAAAAAETRAVALPAPSVSLPSVPPLQSTALVAPPEMRFPRSIRSHEQIRIELNGDGDPTLLSVLQRLLVSGKGDYTFVVSGPIADVRRPAGSESDPGFRRDQIVWQGFSPGRRRLAAVAELRPSAARFLPLRIRTRLRTDSAAKTFEFRIRLTNATAVRTGVFTAKVPRRQLLEALGLVAASVKRGAPPPAAVLTARGPIRKRTITVAAPLALRGRVLVGGRTVRAFSTRLGSDRVTQELVVRGTAEGPVEPKLSVTATPVPPPARPRASGDLLLAAARTNLEYGRFRQYTTFLANPDAESANTASYEFRTGAERPTAQPESSEGGDGSTWPYFLATGLVLVAGAGLVILWAHL